MADAEVATKPAAEVAAPSSTEDSVEQAPPPATQPAATADQPPPAVNGVPEPAAAAVPVDTAVDEAASKSGGTQPSIGAPRIDVTDDSEKTVTTMTNKYEVHDKDTESADRVAAVLKSTRLQVLLCSYIMSTDRQSDSGVFCLLKHTPELNLA